MTQLPQGFEPERDNSNAYYKHSHSNSFHQQVPFMANEHSYLPNSGTPYNPSGFQGGGSNSLDYSNNLGAPDHLDLAPVYLKQQQLPLQLNNGASKDWDQHPSLLSPTNSNPNPDPYPAMHHPHPHHHHRTMSDGNFGNIGLPLFQQYQPMHVPPGFGNPGFPGTPGPHSHAPPGDYDPGPRKPFANGNEISASVQGYVGHNAGIPQNGHVGGQVAHEQSMYANSFAGQQYNGGPPSQRVGNIPKPTSSFQGYDSPYEMPKATKNSLSALGVDDDAEWEKAMKIPNLDGITDNQESMYPLSPTSLPGHDLNNSVFSGTTSNTAPSTPSPWGPSTGPSYAPSTPLHTVPSTPTGFTSPVYNPSFYPTHPHRTMSASSHFDLFGSNIRRPSVPVMRTSGIIGDEHGHGGPIDYFDSQLGMRPTSPTNTFYPQHAQQSQHQNMHHPLLVNVTPLPTPGGTMVSQAQTPLELTSPTSAQNASFRLPDWGFGFARHSTELLSQQVTSQDLSASLTTTQNLDNDVGEVKGSMALYDSTEVDEIVQRSKSPPVSGGIETDYVNGHSRNPTSVDMSRQTLIQDANNTSYLVMDNLALRSPPILPTGVGVQTPSALESIRARSPSLSQQWSNMNAVASDDYFNKAVSAAGMTINIAAATAASVGAEQTTSNGLVHQEAFMLRATADSNGNHVFQRPMSPPGLNMAPNGPMGAGPSVNTIITANDLAASMGQMSLSAAGAGLAGVDMSLGSAGGNGDEDSLPGSESSSSQSKKPMSWAAIAKTPVKPTPVNTEVLALATPPLLSPLSPTALSPPQALSPTSPYAKFGFPSSTGMPLGPQAIPLGSLGPKPMSSPATGSWAAKAKPIVGLPNWTGPVSSGPQLAAPMAIPRPGAPTVAQPPPGTAGPVIKKDLPMSLANKGINPKLFNIRPEHARYFVIKSYTEDDVHKSLKYDIWASTEIGNRRLDRAYRENGNRGPIYLFFSVNASGHFCGMAEMMSPVDYSTNSNVWAQDKWKGVFKVKWVFVKDIPNGSLRHIRLANNENKPVTNSRDTQELYLEPGREMLKVFHEYKNRTSIIDDFDFYDQKQTEMKKDAVDSQPSGAESSEQQQDWEDTDNGNEDTA